MQQLKTVDTLLEILAECPFMKDIYDCLKRFLEAFSFDQRLDGSLIRLQYLASDMKHLANAYETKGLTDEQLKSKLEDVVMRFNPEWSRTFPELFNLKQLLTTTNER